MSTAKVRIAVLLILSSAHSALATEDGSSHLSPAQSFQVGKDGRPILLPVELNQHTYQFLLDTGAAKTCFDITLRSELGRSVGVSRIETPSGVFEMELFTCPEASVGMHQLGSVETVGCADLTPIRCATGIDILGLLGADFLAGKRFEIDFDAGTVRFDIADEPSLNAEAVKLPVSIKKGIPHIAVELPNGAREWVAVDTGANQTTLRGPVFEELIKSRQASEGATHHSVTMRGAHDSRTGTLTFLKIGPHQIDGVVADSDQLSLIGMDQLSRFRILFDLQLNRIVLQPGAQFAKPKPTTTTGMSIIQLNGSKVVTRITEGGAASLAGLEPGDCILRVNDVLTEQIDMFQLRQLLTEHPSEIVKLVAQRGRYVMEFQLKPATIAGD